MTNYNYNGLNAHDIANKIIEKEEQYLSIDFDKIVITFNYNKGTKTVTFEDLKASNILSNSDTTSAGEPEKSTCESKCFFQRNLPLRASEIASL